LFLLVLPEYSDTTKQESIPTLISSQHNEATLLGMTTGGASIQIKAILTESHQGKKIKLICNSDLPSLGPLFHASVLSHLKTLLRDWSQGTPRIIESQKQMEWKSIHKEISQLTDQIGEISHSTKDKQCDFEALIVSEAKMRELLLELSKLYSQLCLLFQDTIL